MFPINHCPSCGCDKIKPVRRDWADQYHGASYSVPDLEFHEYLDCGEKIYDREARRRIESVSPAFEKTT